MHSLKKGQINFMVELFIGAILILLIVVSSYYFAGQANIEANAIVYAENTESNCYINLNTIMQSDQFLDVKTSTKLSEDSYANEIQETNLKAIRDELQIMMPTSRFSLALFDECLEFRGSCDEKRLTQTAEASTIKIENERIQFSDMVDFETCNYPIPVECNLENYVNEEIDERCTRFIEMRLNY
jgi:hypothetical protein